MAFLDLKIEIRPVREEDIARIVEIERSSFKDAWSYFSFLAELRNPSSRFFVATIEDEVIGYIILWEFSELLHIANIAVHPSWRRKGIGRRLIEKAISYAKENKIGGITLEVRVHNEIAQRFYEKNGFRKMGRINYYYKNGEDAFVYRKDLK